MFVATTASDEPSWRVVRVSDQSAHDVRNFESTFGDAILRRTDSGSLVSEEGDSSRELLPAACGARVLHADRADDTIIVACTAEGNGLDVLRGGRRLHTGCKAKHVDGVDLRDVTCSDAPPRTDFVFLSFETRRFSAMTNSQLLERPLVAEAGGSWHRRELPVRPEIRIPQVELCSSHPVLDLKDRDLDPPNQRRVTLGTTSGLVLEAAGSITEGRSAVAIGPLFWAPPTDPRAHCPSWEEMRQKLRKRFGSFAP